MRRMLLKTIILAVIASVSAVGVKGSAPHEPKASLQTLVSFQKSVLGICDDRLLPSAEVVFVKGQSRLTQANLSWGGAMQAIPEDKIVKGKRLNPGATIEVGESGFVSLLIGAEKRTVNLQPYTKTYLKCIPPAPIASIYRPSDNLRWDNLMSLSHAINNSYLSAAVRG